ncbi:MAG: tRNA dihydrouridine synthase DusB [Candidatus Omnitrophica bacterium]|nr:tRNA dihydrouridine synthase DusB [Candidatus Omnitrophota bacterium]
MVNMIYPSRFILAPMAGISDLAFRMINRGYGCGFAFTEMIHARSLCYESRKTYDMLRSQESDQPLGVQLLGNEEAYLVRALDKLPARGIHSIDLNAGCPQPKVVKKGEGAGLLKDPALLQRLLSALVRHASCPVTLKMRLGWSDSREGLDIARRAEDAGVQAICVHARTQQQMFSGAVNHAALAAIKKNVRIPVFASGDIFNGLLAKQMLEQTGCDGVFIARGSLGNPWIFREINDYLRHGTVPPEPSSAQVAQVMRHHLQLCREIYEEDAAVVIFRKFFIWYTRGFAEVKILRQRANDAKTCAAVETLIEAFDEQGARARICPHSRAAGTMPLPDVPK